MSSELFADEETDLLNRKEFIDSVINFVTFYSNQKKSISFSINGEWGSGKTWSINNLINNLYEIQSEESYSDRFCIFKYNAWEYDYYDEPIVSLLVSLKEQISNDDSIFLKSEKARAKYEGAKNYLKDTVLENFDSIVDACAKLPIVPVSPTTLTVTTGIKIFGNIFKRFKKELEELNKEIEKQQEELKKQDSNFDLKELLKKVNDGLKKVTTEKTLIIVIDELDRCLPEYAIKVLERMHHIVQGVPNVQFIYAIDDKQLSNTVKQIFGNEVSVNSYLSKFMTFGLRIPDALFNELVNTKYAVFDSIFAFLYSTKTPLFEIINSSLGEIPIRSKIQILEKVKIINQLLQGNKRDFDYSIFQFELFLAYCDYYGINLQNVRIEDSGGSDWMIDMKPDSSIDLKKCNTQLRLLMDDVKSQVTNQGYYYILQENMKTVMYFPVYFLSFCNEYDGLPVWQNDLCVKLQKKGDFLKKFWTYYKSMEL